MFNVEDWRSPFVGYLADGILPQKHNKRYKLRKLVTHYFLHKELLFKKEYDGDPIWCLGPDEAMDMLKEVHLGNLGNIKGERNYISASCRWAITGPLRIGMW